MSVNYLCIIFKWDIFLNPLILTMVFLIWLFLIFKNLSPIYNELGIT